MLSPKNEYTNLTELFAIKNMIASLSDFSYSRSCPVCDATSPEGLYRQVFGNESPLLIKSYDVSVCSHCGCGYADNIPTQEQFDKYYRDMSKYEYAHQGGKSSPYDTPRFNQTADEIEMLRPDKLARILDIGCATGQFLSVLKSRGYSNIQGADPSPRCAQIARDLYGIEVITSPLDSLISEERFDLISLIAVVEHLREAKSALLSVLPMLQPDGLLLIEVPDASRFADFDNAPFQQFSVEHINFFTIHSLSNLMATLGMELVWHKDVVREISQRTFDPGILAAYRPAANPVEISFDAKTKTALNAYITKSSTFEEEIVQRLDPLIELQTPLIIWGVGTNVLHLLNATKLKNANIVAFVDSNPKYQGRMLAGCPVISPELIEPLEGSIVIGSWVSQVEIEKTICETLCLRHPIVKLYPIS